MEIIRGNLYDYPKYYDVLFGSDWKAEFDFLRACFARHARRRVGRVFEPACGTGRLLLKFAAAGYEVGGNDLNAKAVAYCNARLTRHGVVAAAQVGDMADFRLRRKVDAAFNTINTFRHLASEAAAESHLRCVAAALARGGLYLLGFHLTPRRPRAGDSECWSARRGHLQVNSSMWSIDIDRRRREERVGFAFDIYTPRKQYRLEDELRFRTYTAGEFDALLARVPELETVATYDFTYDVDRPIRVSGTTEDVVYVLRKR
jgi:SAM-dependent methyltransferase